MSEDKNIFFRDNSNSDKINDTSLNNEKEKFVQDCSGRKFAVPKKRTRLGDNIKKTFSAAPNFHNLAENKLIDEDNFSNKKMNPKNNHTSMILKNNSTSKYNEIKQRILSDLTNDDQQNEGPTLEDLDRASNNMFVSDYHLKNFSLITKKNSIDEKIEGTVNDQKVNTNKTENFTKNIMNNNQMFFGIDNQNVTPKFGDGKIINFNLLDSSNLPNKSPAETNQFFNLQNNNLNSNPPNKAPQSTFDFFVNNNQGKNLTINTNAEPQTPAFQSQSNDRATFGMDSPNFGTFNMLEYFNKGSVSENTFMGNQKMNLLNYQMNLESRNSGASYFDAPNTQLQSRQHSGSSPYESKNSLETKNQMKQYSQDLRKIDSNNAIYSDSNYFQNDNQNNEILNINLPSNAQLLDTTKKSTALFKKGDETREIDFASRFYTFTMDISGIKSNQIISTQNIFQSNIKTKITIKTSKMFKILIQEMLDIIKRDETAYRPHQGESISVCILYFVLSKLEINRSVFLEALKHMGRKLFKSIDSIKTCSCYTQIKSAFTKVWNKNKSKFEIPKEESLIPNKNLSTDIIYTRKVSDTVKTEVNVLSNSIGNKKETLTLVDSDALNKRSASNTTSDLRVTDLSGKDIIDSEFQKKSLTKNNDPNKKLKVE